jgi:hypothetical protein
MDETWSVISSTLMRLLATVLVVLIILLIAFPMGFAMAGSGPCPDCHGVPTSAVPICLAVLSGLSFLIMTFWTKLTGGPTRRMAVGFLRTIQRPPQFP